MLRRIRIILAVTFIVSITMLFLDFTGTLHPWLGWLAEIQFIPALLSLNILIIAGLILTTLLLGRVYCSVICPLGVMQDIISWFAGRSKRNRFKYSAPLNWLRYALLALFTISVFAGIGVVVALLEPYSAYGRIVSSLLSPLYMWANNGFAYLAEITGSYAFYNTDVWIKSGVTVAIAAVTLAVIAVMAWIGGRSYCNTVCPVGTILGFISRFSVFRPQIDTAKCNGCKLCARRCKSSCIDSENHKIDYSRCVACMDCIGNCRQGAINYTSKHTNITAKRSAENDNTDYSRRSFLTVTSLFIVTSAVKAQGKKVDGGLAAIQDKKIPERANPIKPAGALSEDNFTRHCTACQLCVSACPNHVLRPSGNLSTLMQPEISYERGYCRPECTECSEVCPTGAIKRITVAEKSAIQIGHAVWIKKNCIVTSDGVKCDNCARHCPTGAILMVEADENMPDKPKLPAVNTERCIGCGACETLCPARPFSAMYVEGHKIHRTI